MNSLGFCFSSILSLQDKQKANIPIVVKINFLFIFLYLLNTEFSQFDLKAHLQSDNETSRLRKLSKVDTLRKSLRERGGSVIFISVSNFRIVTALVVCQCQ